MKLFNKVKRVFRLPHAVATIEPYGSGCLIRDSEGRLVYQLSDCSMQDIHETARIIEAVTKGWVKIK